MQIIYNNCTIEHLKYHQLLRFVIILYTGQSESAPSHDHTGWSENETTQLYRLTPASYTHIKIQ